MGNSNKGEVRYCFKCGATDHISKDCKKIGPLKCIAHPEASSHEKKACWVWRKANGLPVTTSSRSSSKERRRDGPPGDTSGGAPQPASGTQNLVSGENLVYKREIYTSDSSDSEVACDGAYGGYEA